MSKKTNEKVGQADTCKCGLEYPDLKHLRTCTGTSKPADAEKRKQYSIHLESDSKEQFYVRLRALIPEDLFEKTSLTKPADAEMEKASEIQPEPSTASETVLYHRRIRELEAIMDRQSKQLEAKGEYGYSQQVVDALQAEKATLAKQLEAKDAALRQCYLGISEGQAFLINARSTELLTLIETVVEIPRKD